MADNEPLMVPKTTPELLTELADNFRSTSEIFEALRECYRKEGRIKREVHAQGWADFYRDELEATESLLADYIR
jgi:hypothetical protein